MIKGEISLNSEIKHLIYEKRGSTESEENFIIKKQRKNERVKQKIKKKNKK